MEDASTAFELGIMFGRIIAIVLMIGVPVLFIVSLILAFVGKSKGLIISSVIFGVLCLASLGTGIYEVN